VLVVRPGSRDITDAGARTFQLNSLSRTHGVTELGT